MVAIFIALIWIPGLAEPPKQNCRIFYWVIHWNVLLAAFNLLPLPGLDGYDIIRSVLSLPIRSALDRVRTMGFVPLILIFAVGPRLLGFLWPSMQSLYIRMIPETAFWFAQG